MKNRLRRRKFILYSSAILSTSLMLKACGGETNQQTTIDKTSERPNKIIRTGKTIKVGFLYSITGSTAISETVMLEAQKLAIEEINALGGILGKKIEIIVEDGSSDDKIFADKAMKLIDNIIFKK